MSASQLPTARRSPAHGQRTTTANGVERPEPPVVLQRYRLHRRLGAGAFATVWLARDQRLARDVAVKIVPRERVIGRRFEREALAAARLSHPGIVTLYEAAVDDENAYLVSELVRGEPLGSLLDAGRLSDRDIVGIAIALCDALAHAHARGIVHRDVKPSNVLIPERPQTEAEVAKLTDFGVARVVGGDSLTRAGDVIGTAAYMSPEQAEGLLAGAPADLYSLALVIYEALTDVNPVRTWTATPRARRLGAHLPALRRQRRDLPRELGQGIDLALRPRPRERGTIEDLRDALHAGLDRVEDRPGALASPWRRRTAESQARAPHANAQLPSPSPGLDDCPADGSRAWRARALAAALTAALTAWLCAHLLSPSPVTHAAAATVAAALTLVLPRVGWLLVAATLTVAVAVEQHPGAALVIAIAGLVPVALLPRVPTAWPMPLAAPALAVLGLAGAWPALASRAARPWRRAGLAATGWIWLVLAAPLIGRDLYIRRDPRTGDPAVWTRSLHTAIHDVLGPLVRGGVLAPAAVWALAALTLPLIVRKRSLALDLIRVTIWAAATASAVSTVLEAAGVRPLVTPQTAVVGAIASGIVALSPTAVTAWRATPSRATRRREFRSMESP